MYCPERFYKVLPWLSFTIHTRGDYSGKLGPEKWNPLRWQVTLFPGTQKNFSINKDGLWHVKFSNFIWKLKRGNPND